MEVTIYHNPRCGTSRTVLAILRERGIVPRIIEYLATPPDRATLEALLKMLILSPCQLMRRKEPIYQELGLDDPELAPDMLIDAVLSHPILIERPIVVSGKGARLCRPADRVAEIL